MTIELGRNISEDNYLPESKDEKFPRQVINYTESEVGSEQREKIREAVQTTIDNWEDFFKEIISAEGIKWSEKLSLASERMEVCVSQLQDIQNDYPELSKSLENINRCLGGIPALFEANASLAKSKELSGIRTDGISSKTEAGLSGNENFNQLSKKERWAYIQKTAKNSASWQREAIWSLIALDSMEFSGQLPEGTTKRFIDVLNDSLIQCENTLYDRDGNEITDSIRKGLFGPVKYAILSKRSGFRPYVAPANWDVNGKIDMLSEISPDNFLATQIKTSSGPSRDGKSIRFIDDSNELYSEKSKKDYSVINSYCAGLKSKQEWSDYDFHPTWLSMWAGQASTEQFISIISGEVSQQDISYFQSYITKLDNPTIGEQLNEEPI